MRLALTLVFPKKSHRKKVHIPRRSALLAEFFGAMLGDGGINNPWQANLTMNAIADKQYAEFLVRQCVSLFGILPAVRMRKGRQALVVSLASITLVDFLVESGLPRGNKLKSGVRIPDWILMKNSYRSACARGLMDTDGCLFVHTHKVGGKIYKNIGLCFTSHSPKLIDQMSHIFEEFGILAHISGDGRKLYLYRTDAVERYLKVIGTSNQRILGVYENWRRRIAV